MLVELAGQPKTSDDLIGMGSEPMAEALGRDRARSIGCNRGEGGIEFGIDKPGRPAGVIGVALRGYVDRLSRGDENLPELIDPPGEQFGGVLPAYGPGLDSGH